MLKRLFLLVSFLAWSCPGSTRAGRSTGELRAEIKSGLKNYLVVLQQDFKAQLTSRELKQAFEAGMARKMPVPAKIEAIYMRCERGKPTIEVQLASLPPAYRERIQKKANEMIRASPFTRHVEKMTHSLLNTAIELLLSEENMDVIKETPELLDVEINEMDEPFFIGGNIHSMRFIFDRKKELLTAVRFNLDDNQFAAVKVDYGPVWIPKQEAKVMLQRHNTIAHNIKGFSLPRRIELDYSYLEFE